MQEPTAESQYPQFLICVPETYLASLFALAGSRGGERIVDSKWHLLSSKNDDAFEK